MKWPISCERTINKPLPYLWEIICKPGHLNKFHPYCKKNEALKWPGIDAKDTLTYLNEKTYKREIIEWDEKHSFSLVIGEIDGPKSLVKWEFESSKESSNVRITIYPHLLINWPSFLSYLPYKLYIKPKLTKYLHAVIGGLKQYAESGKKINKALSEKHSWFS